MGSCKCPVCYSFLFLFLLDYNINTRPRNKQELFNLRHASARNVIERIFGVLKGRFRILLLAPQYSLNIQAQIPAALCAIHNFIRTHDSNEGPSLEERDLHNHDYADFEAAGDLNLEEPEQETTMTARRDQIAQEMWEDYQRIIMERGVEHSEETANEDEDNGDENM